MSTVHRVLFPVDLSFNFRSLSPLARQLFDRREIEIVILHVVEESSSSGRANNLSHAVAQMEFWAHQEFRHARINLRTERGRASECILRYARSRPVDRIVMPAGGFESLRRKSTGHVTEEVLAAAPCEVWVEGMSGSVESGKLICCAVGLEEDDEAVLSRAAELACELDTNLTIIHAAADDTPASLWWDPDAAEQDLCLARLRAEELRERFAPRAQLHVEAGDPDTVVNRVLYRQNASLLVAKGKHPDLFGASLVCPILRLSATPALQLVNAVGRSHASVLMRGA
jgi:nucleotide-binding universal stress UspA family protein